MTRHIPARRLADVTFPPRVAAEHDADMARDLVRIGHGRLATAHTYRDVAPTVSRLFTA